MRSDPHVSRGVARWTDAIFRPARPAARDGRLPVGVLPGEGIGPEVTAAALAVLRALEPAGVRVDLSTGGPIGRDAELLSGRPLTDDVAAFCEGVFAAGGAVLAGAGGGRFVYDLRWRFDLFCKLSPLKPIEALRETGRLKAAGVDGADILVVRENVGGEYLGQWRELSEGSAGRACEHSFRYSEAEVGRILGVAARLAAARRGRLAVVVKDAGLPAMSGLWRDVARAAAESSGVGLRILDVDLAAYLLLQEPLSFDVVAASNLFGDILADLGAVLLASRGVSFSGNFSEDGAAVYQTNHGSALDLAGQDRANPVGQIASAAMMLRESFGLAREAAWIEDAVAEVLASGCRTFDVGLPGSTVVGTAELGRRIAAAVERRARSAA
ncbi:MAG TPA: isocitrate/isopropylmalate family dehydrogenase [Thermoanaerobaculia bacterium]|nr:isocitrate/isopropylmalate family dehydrogenase [Thermoanaerobaculia bacterium]